jgi:hypothetical protein
MGVPANLPFWGLAMAEDLRPNETDIPATTLEV